VSRVQRGDFVAQEPSSVGKKGLAAQSGEGIRQGTSAAGQSNLVRQCILAVQVSLAHQGRAMPIRPPAAEPVAQAMAQSSPAAA